MNPKSKDIANEAIRAELLALAAANEGLLNPSNVVDAARDPASPLHREFEWNDDDAAELYRLAQAGALIRRVKIKVVRQAEKGSTVSITTTRGFESLPSQRTAKGGYEPLPNIMADPVKRNELLETVKKQLAAYRKRYASLVELAEVWYAVDALIQDRDVPATDDSRLSV